MSKHSKKLIALVDSYHIILYEALDSQVTSGPTDPGLAFPHHNRPEKAHGSYNKSYGYNISASDPHTMPKEVDQNNTARVICEHLETLLADPSDYDEFTLIAEPRMLGCMREHMSKNVKKKLTQEIHKDLMKGKKEDIESAVFGE